MQGTGTLFRNNPSKTKNLREEKKGCKIKLEGQAGRQRQCQSISETSVQRERESQKESSEWFLGFMDAMYK